MIVCPACDSPRGEQPIQLRSLDIRVTVTGQFAQTTQTMCFHNPNARVLEGELTFPLPDNSVVCGYALDIDGRMVDGVIVAKKEARQILEAEIRKGIDPGLVEQTQGNVYRTRVYPIPARGTRTVSITYTSDLTLSGNEAAYHLPLQHAEQLDEVSLRIEVRQTPVVPKISGGQGNMTLTDWQNMWVAEARLTRGVPTDDLLIRLPDLPDRLTMVETTQDSETFFCVSELIKKQGHGSGLEGRQDCHRLGRLGEQDRYRTGSRFPQGLVWPLAESHRRCAGLQQQDRYHHFYVSDRGWSSGRTVPLPAATSL